MGGVPSPDYPRWTRSDHCWHTRLDGVVYRVETDYYGPTGWEVRIVAVDGPRQRRVLHETEIPDGPYTNPKAYYAAQREVRHIVKDYKERLEAYLVEGML